MPNKPAATVGEAWAQARTAVAQARLADPDDHFPYRLDDVTALIDDDAPLGPSGPDDDAATAADFTSERIAKASAAYIDAQAAYLETSTRAAREAYEAAKEDLVAARRVHRRARVDDNGNPTGAIVANTRDVSPDYLRGPRLRRAGEE